MPIPSIDFDNHVIQELPLKYRIKKYITWLKGIIGGGSKWLYNSFVKYCKGDSISLFWDSSSNYVINDIVKTYDGLFICIKIDQITGFNTNNNPNLINSNTPEDNWWYKISSSYLGADERSNYSSQKLSMEKFLNRVFMTEFRQPLSFVSGGYLPLSDIYIQTVIPSFTSFVSFTTNVGSSASYTNNSGHNASFTVLVTGIDTTYRFIIYIPTSLSSALGSSYEQIIRRVADSVYLFGTSYTIITY